MVGAASPYIPSIIALGSVWGPFLMLSNPLPESDSEQSLKITHDFACGIIGAVIVSSHRRQSSPRPKQKNMKTENNWLMDELNAGALVVPAFPGLSLGNMAAAEADAIRAEASAQGINLDSLMGVSACGRYFITAGTKPSDLRFISRS